MGQFVALEVRGPSVCLDLPTELGKISPWVNVRRLKFFEQRDADFTDFQGPVTRVRGNSSHLGTSPPGPVAGQGVSGPVEGLLYFTDDVGNSHVTSC